MIKRRNLFLCILFSIITCGIYAIYWFVVLTNDTNKLAQNNKTASGGLAFLFCIITCGIYGLYWAYKLGKKVGEIEGGGSHGGLYLVLCFFALGWIDYLLAQSALNSASERLAQQQQVPPQAA